MTTTDQHYRRRWAKIDERTKRFDECVARLHEHYKSGDHGLTEHQARIMQDVMFNLLRDRCAR